jgi:hypothetical protein
MTGRLRLFVVARVGLIKGNFVLCRQGDATENLADKQVRLGRSNPTIF